MWVFPSINCLHVFVLYSIKVYKMTVNFIKLRCKIDTFDVEGDITLKSVCVCVTLTNKAVKNVLHKNYLHSKALSPKNKLMEVSSLRQAITHSVILKGTPCILLHFRIHLEIETHYNNYTCYLGLKSSASILFHVSFFIYIYYFIWRLKHT